MACMENKFRVLKVAVARAFEDTDVLRRLTCIGFNMEMS